MVNRIYWLLVLMLTVQLCTAQTPTGKLLQQIAQSKADTTRIDLLVQLGGYYLFKPGEDQTDLDSARNYFNQALTLSKTLHTKKRELEVLKLIGDAYLEGRDLSNGKFYFKQVTDHYHQLGDTKQEAATWARLADCIPFIKGAMNAEKLRVLEHARPLFVQLHDTLSVVDIRYNTGKVYLTEGNGVQAERELLQALSGYKALHYRHFYTACSLLADAIRLQQDPGKTLSYRLAALKGAEAAGSKSWVLSLYKNLAMEYLELGEENKSLLYVKKIKDDLIREKVTPHHQSGNLPEEARGWIAVGDGLINNYSRAIDEKISCYERARQLLHQLHDTLSEAGVLQTMADNHVLQGKPELAEPELQKALAGYQAMHYQKLYPAYRLLVQSYRLQGNLYQELFYNLELLKNMQAIGDTSYIWYEYMKIGLTYQNLDLNERSLYYYQQAWQSVQQYRKVYNYYQPALQVVSRLIALNRTAEALDFIQKATKVFPPEQVFQRANVSMALAHCYNMLKDYPKAEYYYLQMIHAADTVLQRKEDIFENYIMHYRVIVNFYLQYDQFAKAALYLGRMPAIAGHKISPIAISQLHYFQFRIDSAAGRYTSAIRHFSIHKKLNDSLFNAAKSQQINELNIRYETDKKQDSIRLQGKDIQLLRNQEQLQKGQVQRSVFTRNVWIGGFCMLLLLLGVVYNRYRLKKRNNLLLEEQKQEISANNTHLELLLRDNEWLLREVHHRVKNNLQLVMSLLNSQSTYLQDEAALHAVLESQHRVQSMSLIHQKLYKTDNVSSIYMPEYIRDLVDYLKSSFKTKPSLYFDLQVDPIDLDVLHAVPVGLILNEAITNALKYAFPTGDQNTITIRLFRGEEDLITLVVADNGRGLPDGFDIHKNNSFGMILMQGLTEDLGGRLTLTSHAGTTVTMTFANTQLHKRVL